MLKKFKMAILCLACFAAIILGLTTEFNPVIELFSSGFTSLVLLFGSAAALNDWVKFDRRRKADIVRSLFLFVLALSYGAFAFTGYNEFAGNLSSSLDWVAALILIAYYSGVFDG